MEEGVVGKKSSIESKGSVDGYNGESTSPSLVSMNYNYTVWFIKNNVCLNTEGCLYKGLYSRKL